MILSLEDGAKLKQLLKERGIEHEKLVQACQSGSYKAWKKRRRKVDILNAKLRALHPAYGDEKCFANINSKDGLIKLDVEGNKI